MRSTTWKALPGPRGRPDLKKAPTKTGQTAFRYPKGPRIDLPGYFFVDLCKFFQTGAVGNGPGPKFGRKLAENQPNTKQIRTDCLQVPRPRCRRNLRSTTCATTVRLEVQGSGRVCSGSHVAVATRRTINPMRRAPGSHPTRAL